MSFPRVAALCDIHGNLPALEAVLEDVRRARVDCVVVGGDVFPGPLPNETLECLIGLDIPVQFLYGNGELGMIAQMEATDPAAVTYWGTTSGAPLPEHLKEVPRWTARQLQPEVKPLLASWPKTVRFEIDGLGEVLFCHGTPQSETDVFTKLTPEDRLAPMFEELGVSMVVCGHTHMQFDRMIAGVRVVNAGSVGMPFGGPGADWLLLGPDVELRHTMYDFGKAAEIVRATKYPQAEEFAGGILHPRSASEMLELFTKWSLGVGL